MNYKSLVLSGEYVYIGNFCIRFDTEELAREFLMDLIAKFQLKEMF